jgi:tetratricopeptide (TPR) repeat protein
MNPGSTNSTSGGANVGLMTEARLLAGDHLRSAGRFEEARAAYLGAIGSYTAGLARAYFGMGLAFQQEGRLEEARRPFEQAATLDPNRAEYWDQLGAIYEWAEEYPGAAECWRRVLALAPDTAARPHIGLGWALQQMRRLDEARTEFLAAAALEPDSPGAPLSLGLLELERGDFPAAEAAFRRALAISPACHMALYWLANMRGADLPDEDLAALEARLDDPATGEEPRTRLLFALGQAHDARKEYRQAARYLRQANALQDARVRIARGYDPAERTSLVDGLIRVFDRGLFARLAGAGLDSRKPVFVVGLPRSGTTLIEQVLASHPEVHGGGELLLGPRAFDALPAIVGKAISPVDCVPLLQPTQIRDLAQGYLEQLDAIGGGRAERVVDKLPENYLLVGLLRILFPNAAVIHCRRDLRDVALSCWTADFRSVPWASDPGNLGQIFRDYLRMMDHWRAILPAPMLEIEYEEVVADFDNSSRRMIAAAGLEWDPTCADFHRGARSVHTGSRVQVRQPLHSRSVAKWKHYEHELADLFAALPGARSS